MSEEKTSFIICPNPDCQEKLSCKAKFCSNCGMKQAVASNKVSHTVSGTLQLESSETSSSEASRSDSLLSGPNLGHLERIIDPSSQPLIESKDRPVAEQDEKGNVSEFGEEMSRSASLFLKPKSIDTIQQPKVDPESHLQLSGECPNITPRETIHETVSKPDYYHGDIFTNVAEDRDNSLSHEVKEVSLNFEEGAPAAGMTDNEKSSVQKIGSIQNEFSKVADCSEHDVQPESNEEEIVKEFIMQAGGQDTVGVRLVKNEPDTAQSCNSRVGYTNLSNSKFSDVFNTGICIPLIDVSHGSKQC